MKDATTGSPEWWQARCQASGPEITRCPSGEYDVTFWWRDPGGCQSAIRRVWLYVTGVTDHHGGEAPPSLLRVPDTDAWGWTLRLPADWRGSYCFIPSQREDDFADVTSGADRRSLRHAWRRLVSGARADPLNSQSWPGGRGHPMSALSLPDAPLQPGWDAPSTPFTPPVDFLWHSAVMNNTRRVWVFTTGQARERPLALLLDGQFWAQSMPVWPALQTLTDQGALPPAVYLLVDAIDDRHRSRELPCNPTFWRAVMDELLPRLQRRVRFSARPQTTVVAGQSFGGLAALYAALMWPQRFGCALSQSGSFWWPDRAEGAGGWLMDQIAAGRLSPDTLRIWLTAGTREPQILQVNHRLIRLLTGIRSPRELYWHEVNGGHDALCWRGGLTAGLVALWSRDARSR